MSTGVKELDVVRLTRAIDGWPAGTEGTVLSITEDRFLLEVGAEDDSARDLLESLIAAPSSAFRVIWHSDERA